MAKVAKDNNWLTSEDFVSNPMQCQITAAELVQGKFGQDLVLFFKLPNGEIKCMSCFKQTKNALVEAYGDETDNWKGKIFLLSEEEQIGGKKFRKIIAR